MDEPVHVPVMVREVIERLDPRPGQKMLDATVGLGGHASPILERIRPGGLLIGIDRDAEALRLARRRLRSVGEEFVLHHGRFSGIAEAIRSAGAASEGGLDGILFDLGLSSYQLDTASRGFGFSREGPLDMRMDPSAGESAGDFLGKVPVEEIERVLREFGEEPAAKRIARAIDRNRREGTLRSTVDLARAVEEVLPRRGKRIHPATRTFQALRIMVNDELSELRLALQETDRFLAPGGRVVVLSYHSLEDRIVKVLFRERAKEGIFAIDRPDPLLPCDEEIRSNPRSRSVRMRSAARRG
jgi:16S rRNA (cytosine1402-N4)-methyltransferase